MITNLWTKVSTLLGTEFHCGGPGNVFEVSGLVLIYSPSPKQEVSLFRFLRVGGWVILGTLSFLPSLIPIIIPKPNTVFFLSWFP